MAKPPYPIHILQNVNLIMRLLKTVIVSLPQAYIIRSNVFQESLSFDDIFFSIIVLHTWILDRLVSLCTHIGWFDDICISHVPSYSSVLSG